MSSSRLTGCFCWAAEAMSKLTVAGPTSLQLPRYQEYLRKANILREKFADILYNGIFSNRDYHSIDNPGGTDKLFPSGRPTGGDRTQSSEDHAETTVSVPTYRLESYDSINRDIIVDRGKVIIPRMAWRS